MSKRPARRKKADAYDGLVDRMGGSLFDTDLKPEAPDPVIDMLRYVMHWRLMVFSDTFPHVHPGTILSFGQPDDYRYPNGVVMPNGKITIPRMGNMVVNSLTAFATAVSPSDWTKTEKSGRVTKARPSGWDRVWVTLDHGGSQTVDEILNNNYKDLGYSAEELMDIESIYKDMVSAGHGEDLTDILSELKSYRTRKAKTLAEEQAKSQK